MAERSDFAAAVLLTGVGKRHDIVSAFARHAFTIAADPNPLAPAQYAAHVRVAPPRIDDPGYVPFLAGLVAEHGVGAVVPLTDLDIHVLAAARGELPAFVAPERICVAMFDKYRTHETLLELGLPSPPTVLPGTEPERYPVMGGPEFSVDVLCDLDGRCLNAIPRTMLESRGGESIKGQVLDDPELVDLARRVTEALGFRGPSTIQVFRDPEIGIAITDVNPRFGGAFPAPMYAALPGRSYPALIARMAAGERIAPHVGEYRHGHYFTRWYEQLELDAELRPTGRPMLG